MSRHVDGTSTIRPFDAAPEFAVVVERREMLADGVVALTLVDPSHGPLPPWAAGAHIDLILEEGLVRQYSLCGDPADRERMRIAILRERKGRGGSAFVHDRVVEGQQLDARGPRNHFVLGDAERYLFVAGGIGITPILPMIESVARRRLPWHLVYGGRSRSSMAFAEELQARHGEAVTVRPQDETGLLPLGDILADLAGGAAVYCCGPEALLAAMEAECACAQVSELRVERFSPKAVTVEGTDAEFEVELARSGRTVVVGPDATILEALEKVGVLVDSSCREGTCGTCVTDVLEGRPDHRDSVLTPAEQAGSALITVCVSRCHGRRLVLDL